MRSGIDLSELDVLITYFDVAYDGPYSATHLLSGEVRPVCSPSYLRQAEKKDEAIDFGVATLLHGDDRNSWHRWFQKSGLNVSGKNSGTVFADFNLLSIAAIAGHGVALCPVSLISAELERGDLVLLSETPENTDRNYVLFSHRTKNDATEKFCSWAKAVLSNMM
ncbi:MAG: hypothetical protein PPHEINF_4591 [uncultured Paraburkholderia sp.]|nr:MAG: hypothetical protein PPHEINF_4591 [uncultured Paraburkholderia sp.]CAH2935858.1 MAG: hypothetical protein PPHEMADMSA_4649 [uncultured Paraburkholderia sp.]